MGMNLLEQTNTFVFAAVFGMLMGVIFDLLTLTARMFRHKKAALCIFDIIYCGIYLIGSVLFLLIEGTGRLEGYILLGGVLGAILYFVSISSPIKQYFAKKRTLKYKK